MNKGDKKPAVRKKAARKGASAKPKARKAAKRPSGDREEHAFVFRGVVRIPRTTGRKAADLPDLREIIANISYASIANHTYQYFSEAHVAEYTNDFAQWAGEYLEERALAEMLSNIDPYSYGSIDELREELLRVIDYYIENFPEPRKVLPGEEFHFIETINFVFPIGLRARNLAEFLIALKYLDPASIYYHFYEARVRLGRGVDDFTRWIFENIKSEDLAKKIQNIDPFMHTIEGIREHLVEILDEALKEQMEAAK